jgi:hypothetical protein
MVTGLRDAAPQLTRGVSRTMKNLLATTAVLEFGTGLVLIASPSALATLLLGAQLDSPVGLTVARVGGVALLAIGTACWLARLEGHSRVARSLAGAMVIYNAGAVAIFVHAALALRLSGIGLWPAVVIHAAMTAWCITSLLSRRS